MFSETEAFEGLENFDDARMMSISIGDEGEEESGVEERHTFGWPYR